MIKNWPYIVVIVLGFEAYIVFNNTINYILNFLGGSIHLRSHIFGITCNFQTGIKYTPALFTYAIKLMALRLFFLLLIRILFRDYTGFMKMFFLGAPVFVVFDLIQLLVFTLTNFHNHALSAHCLWYLFISNDRLYYDSIAVFRNGIFIPLATVLFELFVILLFPDYKFRLNKLKEFAKYFLIGLISFCSAIAQMFILVALENNTLMP